MRVLSAAAKLPMVVALGVTSTVEFMPEWIL